VFIFNVLGFKDAQQDQNGSVLGLHMEDLGLLLPLRSGFHLG